ncbi:MAG: hypothetical protein AAGC85_25980, partial [Bacteroidota bacterium]
LNHFDKLLRIFPLSSNNIKRKIILAAKNSDSSAWVSEILNTYLTFDSWNKRALLLVVSRKLPEKEKKEFFMRISPSIKETDFLSNFLINIDSTVIRSSKKVKSFSRSVKLKVSNGNLDSALNLLSDFTYNNLINKHDDVIQLESRLSRLKIEEVNGTIGRKERELSYNQISESILDLIKIVVNEK